MTPQEKIEKLRYLQQMQARIAVEQQQQQLIAQGVAPLDPSSLLNGHTQLPHALPLSQPEVPANNVDVKLAVSENDMEMPLSAGQTNADTTSDDEGGSLEAAVLEQLQRTMKSVTFYSEARFQVLNMMIMKFHTEITCCCNEFHSYEMVK